MGLLQSLYNLTPAGKREREAEQKRQKAAEQERLKQEELDKKKYEKYRTTQKYKADILLSSNGVGWNEETSRDFWGKYIHRRLRKALTSDEDAMSGSLLHYVDLRNKSVNRSDLLRAAQDLAEMPEFRDFPDERHEFTTNTLHPHRVEMFEFVDTHPVMKEASRGSYYRGGEELYLVNIASAYADFPEYKESITKFLSDDRLIKSDHPQIELAKLMRAEDARRPVRAEDASRPAYPTSLRKAFQSAKGSPEREAQADEIKAARKKYGYKAGHAVAAALRKKSRS